MIQNTINRNVGNNDFTGSVQTYYQELKKYNHLPKDKERELLELAKNGDIDARNQIITAHLRFVFEIAKKYRDQGVDMADLISEGNNGIIKAIDKFDMEKNVRFFTYAVWWIRQHMMAAINTYIEEKHYEISYDDNTLCDNKSTMHTESDDITEFDDSYSLKFDKADNDSNDENDQKYFVVQKLLAKLDDREKSVIMKYYGLENDDEGHDIKEISQELHLSTERVRQIRIEALNTLRSEVFHMNEANFLF